MREEVMDVERWDATEEVKVTEEKEKSQRWDEVDGVKKEAGSRDTVRLVDKNDQ